MQIGEFASLCRTKISVLRHYDKEGLLHPDYIDRFTNYRYYSAEQAETFFKISVLKSAGFSLSEIRDIIADNKSTEEILLLFESKKAELTEALENLDGARAMLLGEALSDRIAFEESDGETQLRYKRVTPDSFDEACLKLHSTAVKSGYQRVSHFTMETGEDLSVDAVCRVVKLRSTVSPVLDRTEYEFQDDDRVIGRWQVVGEFAVPEDFYHGGAAAFGRDKNPREIFFLPGGERYWCYGWTRGKLIIENGFERTVNDYRIETLYGQVYMLVSLKSYDFKRGGVETAFVLRKLDSRRYSLPELARTDDMCLPFEDDESVIGRWNACDFVYSKESFDPEMECKKPLLYSSIEFFAEGAVRSVFTNGHAVEARGMQEWTRGYLLRKWTKSACAYEIRQINGREYLFLEWKSGDYIYGGRDTNYYVFEREQ